MYPEPGNLFRPAYRQLHPNESKAVGKLKEECSNLYSRYVKNMRDIPVVTFLLAILLNEVSLVGVQTITAVRDGEVPMLDADTQDLQELIQVYGSIRMLNNECIVLIRFAKCLMKLRDLLA
jgi:hypothetical protein